MLAMALVAAAQIFQGAGITKICKKYVICQALNHEDLK